MTISTYDSTYEPSLETSEDSMFGTPIYARRSSRQDRNNKVFMAAGAIGIVVAAGALFWATSAANDHDAAPAVTAATPVAASANQVAIATPVTVPVTPGVDPVFKAAQVHPVLPRARPATLRTASSAPTRLAESAPSATDATADVSTREYAPVTSPPEPAAMAPMVINEPPAAAPIPLVPE